MEGGWAKVVINSSLSVEVVLAALKEAVVHPSEETIAGQLSSDLQLPVFGQAAYSDGLVENGLSGLVPVGFQTLYSNEMTLISLVDDI